MTGQEQQQPQQSAFNQRADTAALALKGELSRKLGVDLPSTKVAVGPDGKSPNQLPPEGSYARAALERKNGANASLDALDIAPAPPVRQPTAEELARPSHVQPDQEQISDRAQSRIGELVALLREKDQQLQQSQARAVQSEQELRARTAALEAQYEQLVRQNLDSLDPETRGEVLRSAAIQQAVQESEKRIFNTFAPELQQLRVERAQRELESLANKYPGFNVGTHGPLIASFRERNPHCSIEQAFRAVATVEELSARQSVSAPAVPHSVPPGRGSPMTRYMPSQQPASDPDAELREETQRAYALLKSMDPAERKAGKRLLDKNLAGRLAGRLPT